jgi:hypothetical protein
MFISLIIGSCVVGLLFLFLCSSIIFEWWHYRQILLFSNSRFKKGNFFIFLKRFKEVNWKYVILSYTNDFYFATFRKNDRREVTINEIRKHIIKFNEYNLKLGLISYLLFRFFLLKKRRKFFKTIYQFPPQQIILE